MSFHQRRSFRTPGPGVELSRGHPLRRALRKLRRSCRPGHGLKVTHVALLGHENSGYSWVGLTLAMPVAAAEAALKASAWPLRGKTRTRKSTGEVLVRERALVPAVNLKGATNWLCGFQGD